MKKRSKVLSVLSVVVLLLSFFVFAACDDGTPAPQAGSKDVTLIIVDAVGEKTAVEDTTETTYVDKWLEELHAENKITLVFTTTQYGMNVSSLNGIEVNGSTTYFLFYSDDAENVNSAWGSYEYNQKTYDSCAYGQSSMPVKDGCTYVLVYTEYQA